MQTKSGKYSAPRNNNDKLVSTCSLCAKTLSPSTTPLTSSSVPLFLVVCTGLLVHLYPLLPSMPCIIIYCTPKVDSYFPSLTQSIFKSSHPHFLCFILPRLPFFVLLFYPVCNILCLKKIANTNSNFNLIIFFRFLFLLYFTLSNPNESNLPCIS